MIVEENLITDTSIKKTLALRLRQWFSREITPRGENKKGRKSPRESPRDEVVPRGGARVHLPNSGV